MHALQVETLGFNPWHSVVFPSTTRSKLSPLEAAPKHHRICSTKKLIHLHVCGRMCAYACIQSLRKSRRLNAIFNLLKVSLRYQLPTTQQRLLLPDPLGILQRQPLKLSDFAKPIHTERSMLHFIPQEVLSSPSPSSLPQSKAPVPEQSSSLATL